MSCKQAATQRPDCAICWRETHFDTTMLTRTASMGQERVRERTIARVTVTYRSDNAASISAVAMVREVFTVAGR